MPKDLGTLSTQSQDKSVSSTDKDESDTCNIVYDQIFFGGGRGGGWGGG